MDRRGLAVEAARLLTSREGVSAVSRRIGAVKITDVRLSTAAARSIGRREGRFITLHGEPSAPGMTALLRRAIMQLIPPRGRLFAAGLGNPDITQDRLGAASIRAMTARRGSRYSLAAVETDVSVKTGLETARLVRAAAREIKADCVIAVDSLSCGDPHAIGKTVQIGSAGITPGSGAHADGGELSPERLGCAVVSIGVPAVAELSAVTKNPADRELLISTADIDTIINMWAEVIGGAVTSIVADK